MNAFRFGTSLAFAALFVAGSVWAQPASVASLQSVNGTVLVSQGDAMVSGTQGQPLPAGTRVVTTAGATVIVHYNTGCDVRLAENQRFVVRAAGECGALIAAVEGTGIGAGAGAGLGAGAGAGLGAGLGGIGAGTLIGGALVVGGGIAYVVDRNRSNNVSPN